MGGIAPCAPCTPCSRTSTTTRQTTARLRQRRAGGGESARIPEREDRHADAERRAGHLGGRAGRHPEPPRALRPGRHGAAVVLRARQPAPHRRSVRGERLVGGAGLSRQPVRGRTAPAGGRRTRRTARRDRGPRRPCRRGPRLLPLGRRDPGAAARCGPTAVVAYGRDARDAQHLPGPHAGQQGAGGQGRPVVEPVVRLGRRRAVRPVEDQRAQPAEGPVRRARPPVFMVCRISHGSVPRSYGVASTSPRFHLAVSVAQRPQKPHVVPRLSISSASRWVGTGWFQDRRAAEHPLFTGRFAGRGEHPLRGAQFTPMAATPAPRTPRPPPARARAARRPATPARSAR